MRVQHGTCTTGCACVCAQSEQKLKRVCAAAFNVFKET